MDNARLEELIAAYVDRNLDAAGEEELLRVLEESADARRALANSTVVAGMLHQAAAPSLEADRIMQVVASEPAGKFADDVMRRIETSKAHRRTRPSPRRVPWAGAAAILAVAATLLLVTRLQPADDDTAPAPAPAPVRGNTFADVDRVHGAVERRAAGETAWKLIDRAGRLGAGDAIRTVDGRVRLVCDSGSTVHLDRFAALTLEGNAPPRFTLSNGEAYVTVATEDVGLVIETPHGRAVDLGTRFTVRATDEGTTVVVEQGRVSASTDAGRATLRTGERVLLVSRAKPPGVVSKSPDAARRLAWTVEDGQRLPGRTVPRSLGIQIKSETDSPEHLDAIAGLGVAFVRRGVYWRIVETQRGVHDFSQSDRLMNDLEKRNLRLVCCLFSGNELYERGAGIRTDAGRAGFADFAAAMAKRYRGRDVVWEIWNEPNIRGFWGDHAASNSTEFADEYTSLVAAVVPAMRRAAPNSCIVAGSVSALWEDSFVWTERCFERGMLATGIDGWSVHPYGTGIPEDHAGGYARVRALMNAHGARVLPILNTTRGFSYEKSANAGERQASSYVRQYMVDLMSDVRLSVWYEWWGRGGESRPAYDAGKVMTELLQGFRFRRRLQTDSAQDYVLSFERRPDELAFVVWTTAKETGRRIRVPVGRARAVSTVVDIHGRRRSVSASGGVLSLGVTDAPRYIILAESKRDGSTK